MSSLLPRPGTQSSKRPLGYERVYLPLSKVADTPFHIQGDEKSSSRSYQFLKIPQAFLVFLYRNWPSEVVYSLVEDNKTSDSIDQLCLSAEYHYAQEIHYPNGVPSIVFDVCVLSERHLWNTQRTKLSISNQLTHHFLIQSFFNSKLYTSAVYKRHILNLQLIPISMVCTRMSALKGLRKEYMST